MLFILRLLSIYLSVIWRLFICFWIYLLTIICFCFLFIIDSHTYIFLSFIHFFVVCTQSNCLQTLSPFRSIVATKDYLIALSFAVFKYFLLCVCVSVKSRLCVVYLLFICCVFAVYYSGEVTSSMHLSFWMNVCFVHLFWLNVSCESFIKVIKLQIRFVCIILVHKIHRSLYSHRLP